MRFHRSIIFITSNGLLSWDAHLPIPPSCLQKPANIILKTAVAGLKMAHLPKITLYFEFSVLTLAVPGLRLRKVQNTSCF